MDVTKKLDRLERSTKNTTEAELSPTTEQEGAAPTVLVVDDDPDSLKITSDVLQHAGILAKGALSGEEAIRQLEHMAVDLVLLDVMMPGLSGIETCKRLKNQPHTQNIPIIFMTALTDADSITAAFEVGASDYITKPFLLQELLVRVRTHLRVQRLQNNLKIRNAELQNNIIELQTTQRALQQAHNELEVRVQERTAELQQANSKLEKTIVDQRWTERALRESERRFRHVIASISDHIYVMRLTPERQQQIVFISPKIEAISGFPQSKFLDNVDFWSSFVVYPQDQHIIKHQWATLRKGKSIEVEYRILRADGKVIWVRDSASVASEASSLAIYGVISDITARVQQQERLQAIHKTSQELTLLHNETAILERLFQIIDDVIKFDHAAYALLSKNQEQLDYWYFSAGGWQPGISLSVNSESGIGPMVARSGHAILIDDMGQEPGDISLNSDFSARAVLCVPMKIQEQVIGVLNLESEQPGLFTRDDQLLLQTLADQSAVAVQSARLYKEIENRVAQISSLALAGRTMSSTLDLDTVLNQTMDVARQMLAAEGVAVLMHDSKQDNLYFAAAASPGAEKMIGKQVPLETSIAGWSFIHNKPVLVTDATRDARFFSGIDKVSGLVTKSLLAVPLIHRQVKIGVLEASNKEGGAFNQEDLEKLETLAYSASSAIANARLFEQVQRGRAQLRHLAQEVVNAQEDERQRLSYELHDEVGQTLTALKLSLELLSGDLPEDCGFLEQKINKAIDLTVLLTQRLRTLARNLRPLALDVVGLNDALEDHCFEFAERVRLEIVYNGQDVAEASEQVKLFLYRCVQESLNNVAKHAKANQVIVTLEKLQDTIQLSVQDDGVGFDVDAVTARTHRVQGIGLLGLQERLEMLGGTLEIISQIGRGTTLIVNLPLEG